MSGYSLECDEMHFLYGMFPIFTTGIKHKQSHCDTVIPHLFVPQSLIKTVTC